MGGLKIGVSHPQLTSVQLAPIWSILQDKGIAIVRIGSQNQSLSTQDCVLIPKYKRVSHHPFSKKIWQLNHAAGEIFQLSPDILAKRLQLEGIPVRLETDSLAQKEKRASGIPLTVAVWGQYALEMRRNFSIERQTYRQTRMISKEEKENEGLIPPEHFLWKPAQRLAVRTLYALGLDYGQVHLLFSDERKFYVQNIFSEPEIKTKRGLEKWKDTVHTFHYHWQQETAHRPQSVIGADPEFVLTTTEGKVVPASRYFPRQGEVGCDSIVVQGEKSWPLVELRPKPSVDPKQLLQTMRDLLIKADEQAQVSAWCWRAGALPQRALPLGGHLHFSGVALHSERLRALDNAVALPLRLLEPRSAAYRRPRYGTLGDFRCKAYPGFEYRTPPSWLLSSSLAQGTLALAKLAVEYSHELFGQGFPLNEPDVRQAFYQADRRNLLLSAAEHMAVSLSTLADYPLYKEEIDYLFAEIHAGHCWNEQLDFRIQWSLPKNHEKML